MKARYSESPPGAALPPRSAASVKSNEKSQGPRSTQPPIAPENPSIQATSSIETLTTTVAAQSRRIDGLVQDNAGLRDEIRNLSQTVKSSKRDQQRFENVMTKMVTELKVKFETTSEKSENRMLGPICELMEELRRTRANPPAFPPTAPYPPEPPAGDSEWTTRDDYAPTEPNKLHYQENFERHRQPVRLTCQFLTS